MHEDVDAAAAQALGHRLGEGPALAEKQALLSLSRPGRGPGHLLLGGTVAHGDLPPTRRAGRIDHPARAS